MPATQRFRSLRWGTWFVLLAAFWSPNARAAHLAPVTLEAWDAYTQAATARMDERLRPGSSFLWIDQHPDSLAKVRAGEIVVAPAGPGIPRKVPSGLIHDWIGAVFVANASLSDVLPVVRDYARYKELYHPSVIDSKVISSSEDTDQFSMLLMNQALLLKTAFDSDYETSYVRVDARRLYSISRSTRVQQVEDFGSPEQRVLGEGEGNGIIWRLFAITRYQERDNGVYIELEALGLSRDIPASLRWLVDPVVRRISRSSLSTSLSQTAQAVRLHCELATRGTSQVSH